MSTRQESLPLSVSNREPLPGSRKMYVNGPDGIRVPFREIALSPTNAADALSRLIEKLFPRFCVVSSMIVLPTRVTVSSCDFCAWRWKPPENSTRRVWLNGYCTTPETSS